jgi:hypothetical protein
MRGLLLYILCCADAVKLRGIIRLTGTLKNIDAPSSFISSSSRLLKEGGSVDWWLWIVIGGLLAAAALFTFVFRKPAGDETGVNQPKVILTTDIISCQQIVTRSSPQIDPIQLGITIKGKAGNGEFTELFHYQNAHETGTSATKFTWDEREFSWILKQPLSAAGPSDELLIQLEQYSASGGLLSVVATGSLPVKPPVVGSMITPRPAVQLVELMSATSSGSVWGNLEISMKYEPVAEEMMDQLEIARKQLFRKLRVTKPLFLASHSLAFVLIVLDSFLGIRYLFSGCFASSVQAIVSAGLISLLSVPMAAEWGQMHFNLPSWAVKVGKLNSQFKATVLLACAIPQITIAATTGSTSCSKFFDTAAGLTFLDFILFSAHFVQAEANGHVAALFHFNCFKRPLPPTFPVQKSSSRVSAEDTSSTKTPTGVTSPNSYAARRALRQQSVDTTK